MTIPEIIISYNPPISIAQAPAVHTSLEAYTLFKEHFPAATISLQERFVVLYLNKAHKPLGMFTASIGGLSGTVVDIRIILAVSLKCLASSIAMAHNHPSSRISPSKQDESLTQKMKAACEILDIKLIDHLIITSVDGQYYSFSDEGML